MYDVQDMGFGTNSSVTQVQVPNHQTTCMLVAGQFLVHKTWGDDDRGDDDREETLLSG
jgi:hypothetical protein